VTDDPWGDPPTPVEQTEESRSAAAKRPTSRGRGGSGISIRAIVAVVLLAALGAWLLVRHDGNSSSSTTTTTSKRAPAHGVSEQQLVNFSGSLGHAIYWAGPQAGTKYELSKTTDGRVFVRYLTAGAKLGDPRPKYLAVGTYPQSNATSVLKATAKKQGDRLIKLRGGGFAFVNKDHPTSVYVAFPGSNFQIEVFDPNPSVARRLVTSGKVVPVGIATAGRAPAKAATAADLQALATQVGHPVYWAGDEANTTYELTQTTDGRIYVRYLPHGISVGDPKPNYLTVGTYPQTNALAALKATAASAHSPTIELSDGAIAYVAKNRPTSVYVARPGEDVLVEVFDPSAANAKQLVTSGKIVAVG
jgi:hypothetical protein